MNETYWTFAVPITKLDREEKEWLNNYVDENQESLKLPARHNETIKAGIILFGNEHEETSLDNTVDLLQRFLRQFREHETFEFNAALVSKKRPRCVEDVRVYMVGKKCAKVMTRQDCVDRLKKVFKEEDASPKED